MYYAPKYNNEVCSLLADSNLADSGLYGSDNILDRDYLFGRFYSKEELMRRKRKRAYGRLRSGIERNISRAVIRRTKRSPLIRGKPTLLHLVLSTVDDEKRPISKAWSVLVKRIRRKYKEFEYCKLRTNEGRKGVLHILAYASEFIEHKWLSDAWKDVEGASVVWSTQCYGNKFSIIGYLLRYCSKHSWWRLGYSGLWVFKGWVKQFRDVFSRLDYGCAIDYWNLCCRAGRMIENKLMRDDGHNKKIDEMFISVK